MKVKTCSISKAGYPEAMDWLRAALKEMDVSQKELLTAELLLEESFTRLAVASGDETSFSAEITLRKRLGNVIMTLSAAGAEFNPIVEMNETADREEEMYTLALLKAHRNEMSYQRRQNRNCVTIRVHEFGNKSSVYTMVGLVAGVLLGIGLKAALPAAMLLWIGDKLFVPVETVFMHALMMLVAPMIFFSVLAGITSMSDAADIGRMGGKLLILSVAKLVIVLAGAVMLGIYMGATPELATMSTAEKGTETAALSFIDVLVGIVPGNLITPFATNNLLQVLFLACFFGMLLVKAGDRAAWAKERIDFFNRFIMDAMGAVLPVMPVVVAVSMTKLMMHTELSVLWNYGKIILGVIVTFFLVLLVSAVFTVIVGRLSPVPLLKKLFVFGVVPFSIRSSNACLPETLEFCMKKLGIEDKLAMFSVPVGIQFNMAGSGAFIVMLAIVMRMTFGLPMDPEFLSSFFFAALMVTFTFPSVPGASIIVMASIFEMAGIPPALVTLFIGIDPLVDGIRTIGNVDSNIVSTFLLARLENKVKEESYRGNLE